MPSGPGKGRADYLELGSYNAVCSMCGRKRKARELERNWQGLYRCPEHNEPRQPQDFVRNVPDIMTVPWGQPQETQFVPGQAGFPASVIPNSVVCAYGTGLPITTEAGEDITTEALAVITTESGFTSPAAQIYVPSWVVLASIQWSWLSGGAGITIDSAHALSTMFSSAVALASGIAQCLLTDTLSGTAMVFVTVTVGSSTTATGGTELSPLILGMNL